MVVILVTLLISVKETLIYVGQTENTNVSIKPPFPCIFYPILMHHDWSLTSQYWLTSVLSYPRQPWSLFSGILLRICWRGITASQVILRSGTITWKITTSNVIQTSTINTALLNNTSAQCCKQWFHIRIFLKEADLSYFLVMIMQNLWKTQIMHAISLMEGHGMGSKFFIFSSLRKDKFFLWLHITRLDTRLGVISKMDLSTLQYFTFALKSKAIRKMLH